MENEYCAKHRCMPVNILESLPTRKFILSATASGSCQSSIDPYDLFSDEEESITPNNVAETTPEWRDCALCLFISASIYLNLPPEALKNRGQIDPNLNDYHSEPMVISSTFKIPDIINWRHQQEKTHSQFTDLLNVAHNIFSIIPPAVRGEDRFSLARDVISWRQSKTKGETIRKKLL